MTVSALAKTVSSTDENEDGTLVVTTHEVTRTYDARALQKPCFISIDISQHDIQGFIRAVRDLEAIDWTDRHYSASRLVTINRIPADVMRFCDGTYVLRLPGVSVHYSKAQVLDAVAALEKEQQRHIRLEYMH